MKRTLEIGRLRIEVSSSEEVLEAIASRYRRFVVPSGRTPAVQLTVAAASDFRPEFERPAPVSLRPIGPGRVALSGAARGEFDLDARAGEVEGILGLGGFDALLRAALSLTLPM